MDEITFLTKEDVSEAHANGLDKYGGAAGVIDDNVLGSNLSKAQFWMMYEKPSDDPVDILPGVASSYLCGFAMNQCFMDGNKRTGVYAAIVFLAANGYRLTVPEDEVYRITKLVATKHLDRDGVIEWMRDIIQPVDSADADE